MTDSTCPRRLRLLLFALLLAVFLLPEPAAWAIPKQPPPAAVHASGASRGHPAVLLARRRRRRQYPRRRRRPKPKPRAPEPAPEPAVADSPEPAQPQAGVDPGNLRRGGRVEFDGRLVQGQTAKSGAIYLFARKRSELRSMVQERTSYRKEVLRTVYPSWESKTK